MMTLLCPVVRTVSQLGSMPCVRAVPALLSDTTIIRPFPGNRGGTYLLCCQDICTPTLRSHFHNLVVQSAGEVDV